MFNLDTLLATAQVRALEHSQKWGWNQEVNSTPYEVIESIGTMRLLRYSEPAPHRQPLLIIPSLINRYYILDLLPEKSFIAHLAQHFTLYVLDWGEARDEEKHLSLESLLELHFAYLYKTLLKDCNRTQAHLLGHCLGGNIATFWSLMHPQDVLSLTLITTPMNLRVNGKLETWAQHKDFDLQALVQAYGHAPWLLLQTAFLGLNPSQIWQKPRRFLEKVKTPQSLRNFMALEIWSADNRSPRGACFHDLINLLYRQNCLLEKGFPFKGKRFFLKDLQCPVAALSSQDDHIVQLDSTLQAEYVPQARAVKLWHSTGGHIGCLLGQKSQSTLWPELVHWLHQQESIHEQSQAVV
ncbi:MAG: alpha/beta fold hydrolase [Bdellovibrio sp.]